MAKTLLVSATLWELECFWRESVERGSLSPDRYRALLPILSQPDFMGQFVIDEGLDCCITGVGVASVLVNLASCPLEHYDWVLGVGFVGSYTETLAMGEVVQVCEDSFADYGLEEKGGFISLANTPFPSIIKEKVFLVASNRKVENLRQVKSFTKSFPTGERKEVVGLDPEVYDAQVESMESAAFALLCSRRARAYTSLRVVSNYVRPDAPWEVPLAKSQLARAVTELLTEA